MKDKIDDLIAGVVTLMEVGCILALTGIALKRNHDCYKAECKLLDVEKELACEKIINISKDIRIKGLEEKLKELKSDVKEES